MLAAARAQRTGEDVLELAEHATQGARLGAVAAILDETVSGLDHDGRAGLAQVARLPLLNAELVDAVVEPGFFDRVLAAGAPFFATDDGWWDLAGPVREFLASLAGPDHDALRRAAARYRSLGLVTAALDLLFAAGDDVAAAAMLSTGDLSAIDAMDVREYRGAVDRLGPAAIRAHPMALILLARFLDSAALFEPRDEVLDRIEKLCAELEDPLLARALAAERANDLVREGRHAEAELEVRAILEVTPSDELLTRARLLSLPRRTLCWRYDEEGRRDADSLREADARFAESAELYERLGMRAAAAGTAPYRSMWIEYARGNAARAGEMLDEAMESVAGRPRRWAYLLTMRAEVDLELGQHDEFWRAYDEILRVAAQLKDEQLVAYAHWNAMESASRAGDAMAVLEHLRAVESNKGDWWPAAGGDFCAWAVEALARVGEIALAHEHLRLAREVSTDADALIAMAEGSLLARHGDPEAAEVALRRVPGTGIDPREYWRIDLLRAYAAFRRADRSADRSRRARSSRRPPSASSTSRSTRSAR